jgi:phosphoribosylformylglycinamidine cyclo-ligase
VEQSGSHPTGERAAVESSRGARAVSSLVAALREIDPGRPRRTLLGPGHYASVLALDDHTGVAICTDGVGTKVIIATQTSRFDSIGIDCVAMNVNDIICVGAEPLAMVDYVAIEQAEPEVLRAIGEGLREGAERAGIEIPGGELAVLPELIRGHPSPLGFDLVGACLGTVALDRIVSGAEIAPGDTVIGLPSSGIHSNGLTRARRALIDQEGWSLDDTPEQLGRSLGEELLEPTEIYVKAVIELLRSGTDVGGLAHISGDGLLNLLRLNPDVGYEIDDPLPPQPIFDLIQKTGALAPAEMYETFNMGTGFCCVVPSRAAGAALAILRQHYRSARAIGRVIPEAGMIRIASAEIVGRAGGFAQL